MIGNLRLKNEPVFAGLNTKCYELIDESFKEFYDARFKY